MKELFESAIRNARAREIKEIKKGDIIELVRKLEHYAYVRNSMNETAIAESQEFCD